MCVYAIHLMMTPRFPLHSAGFYNEHEGTPAAPR